MSDPTDHTPQPVSCCTETAEAGTGTNPTPPTYRTVLAATILILLGIVLLDLVITGQLFRYVQPFFEPVMVFTALALIGLGVWTLIQRARPSQISHDHHPLRATSWFILVPVVLAVISAPQPLGASLLSSTAVGGASIREDQDRSQRIQHLARVERNPDGTIAFPPLDRSTTNEITIEELANRYFFGDKDNLADLRVRLVGFASPTRDGQWVLGRFKIYCCAADAIPYQARVNGLDQPHADQWYEIEGVVDITAEDLPLVRVHTATPIDPPRQPYL